VPYVIGTDEAGYGPNLGPLVIAATAWQLPDGAAAEDLYSLLRRSVARRPDRHGRRVAMADSKRLYQSGGGLAQLEDGVFAALDALDCRPRTWRGMWDALAGDTDAARASVPWYADYDPPLPVDLPAERLAAPRLAEGLAAAGVRLAAIRCRAVFPQEFNAAVERLGSKGEALSRWTLSLAAALAETLDGPVSIVCDKHGGRNRYGELLAEPFARWLAGEAAVSRSGGLARDLFGDVVVTPTIESRECSVYRFGPTGRTIEIGFRARAESCLPAALASMTAKYLRELAMRAFNDYWCRRVAGLMPTAGYPGDARRFYEAIAPHLAELSIPAAAVWRSR
jgi:hypothetical protein